MPRATPRSMRCLSSSLSRCFPRPCAASAPCDLREAKSALTVSMSVLLCTLSVTIATVCSSGSTQAPMNWMMFGWRTRRKRKISFSRCRIVSSWLRASSLSWLSPPTQATLTETGEPRSSPCTTVAADGSLACRAASPTIISSSCCSGMSQCSRIASFWMRCRRFGAPEPCSTMLECLLSESSSLAGPFASCCAGPCCPGPAAPRLFDAALSNVARPCSERQNSVCVRVVFSSKRATKPRRSLTSADRHPYVFSMTKPTKVEVFANHRVPSGIRSRLGRT
mmetsp:Transcript_64776/g.189987  ORF Transcript_64776/g.189987 Transcript_64776/m.189987 type:complete len:280 (+) Transcript_64776:1066-1905(+)